MLIDEPKAIKELTGLGHDARLWLMDRIGNHLHTIRLNTHMEQPEMIDKAVVSLIRDMKKIGLFEMHPGS